MVVYQSNRVFSQFSCSVVSSSVTPWIAARQASLSITNSRSLLKLMPIESVMPSSHLILCRPLFLLPPFTPRASGSLPMSRLFTWGGQSIGVSTEYYSAIKMNAYRYIPIGSMGEPQKHYTKWNTLITKDHILAVWLHSHEISRTGKHTETKSRLEGVTGWGDMRMTAKGNGVSLGSN